MGDFQITQKKVTSKEIKKGTTTLVSTDTSIMLTDLVISKESSGRLIVKMNDGINELIILFVDKKGTHNYSFPDGLTFWRGANLEVVKQGDSTDVVTVGYIPVGLAKTWEVFNGI